MDDGFRPARLPNGRRRKITNVRLHPDLRARLEDIAAANGATLSAELETRLQASLRANERPVGVTLEQVRVIIADELRAVLRQEQSVIHIGPHAHSFVSHQALTHSSAD